MLAVRKTSQAFGRGRLTFLRPGNRKVLAYLREFGDEVILCVANVARSAQPVELDLASYRGRVPVEMLGRTAFPPVGELPYFLTLPAHGFYWFRLARAADVEPPRWHEERLVREDVPVLVLFDGWTSFFRDRVVPWRIGMAEKVRHLLEHEVVPRYLEAQRWYAAKGEKTKRARLADHALWEAAGGTWLLAQFDLEGTADPARYFTPLALAWEDTEEARVRALAPATLAKVRQQAMVGVLADALADEAFCRAVVEAIGAGRTIATSGGTLRFAATRAFPELAGESIAALPVARPQAQSSNTVVTLGDRLFLKAYRRLWPGLNPELEVGRFLTEVARCEHCVPVAGALEYSAADGTPMTLALLQGYVSNEGDGWAYTLGYVERFLDDRRNATGPPPPDVHGAYLALVHTLGVRTAELHRALAARTGDPAFDPEPLTAADFSDWKRRVHDYAQDTLDALERARAGLPPAALDAAQALGAERARLLARIDACDAPDAGLARTRYHGDYHLGQVLLTRNDFVITDFEGEPARPLAERRQKHSPLRDVAGMLRSFNYARWTALQRAARDGEDLAALTPPAAAWEADARRAFLAAYDATARAAGLYASFGAVRGVVALAELEKALYEVRYELANRPDWVRIPLVGVLALARPPQEDPDGKL
jgi:maltose alpha-D-glucosyltransferase/alpha-amylase